MSIVSLGTDIVEIARIKKALSRYGDRFFKKICTKHEEAYCRSFADPSARLAGRFAAKEAVFKALSFIWNQPLAWGQVEISNSKNGRPSVILHGKVVEALRGYEVLVSISHCRSHATATVIVHKQI